MSHQSFVRGFRGYNLVHVSPQSSGQDWIVGKTNQPQLCVQGLVADIVAVVVYSHPLFVLNLVVKVVGVVAYCY